MGVIYIENGTAVYGADDAPWDLPMALSVIYSLPPVIFYCIFRRYLTHGLVAGAVQGT